MKQKTINIKDIYHSEVELHNDCFVLVFYNKKHKVRLHFSKWWVPYIAQKLWKVIKHEERVVEQLRHGMKEKEE